MGSRRNGRRAGLAWTMWCFAVIPRPYYIWNVSSLISTWTLLVHLAWLLSELSDGASLYSDSCFGRDTVNVQEWDIKPTFTFIFHSVTIMAQRLLPLASLPALPSTGPHLFLPMEIIPLALWAEMSCWWPWRLLTGSSEGSFWLVLWGQRGIRKAQACLPHPYSLGFPDLKQLRWNEHSGKEIL